MKQLKMWMLAAILICGTAAMFISCAANEDNATPTPTPVPEPTADIPAQLKQGIWTEYDEALLTSGKYTAEELAMIPAVGMKIEGDKGYFFTFTAEEMSDLVEGQINYDNTTGKGTITFPAIKDNLLSGQTVNFSAPSDDIMEFEFTYEGQKTTGTCAWLCENLDNWSSDVTDADWLELMESYQLIAEDRGPDPTIDWSDSDVEGLDKPLEWDDETVAATRGGSRAIGIGTVISMGMEVMGALFEEEKPDPQAEVKDKLNQVMGKIDQVFEAQEKMMNRMRVSFDQMNERFDQVNARLIEIAQKLKKQEIVNIFNNRNDKYYNKLKVRNKSYFDDAYKLYKDNKNDLSKVSDDLRDYAKEWVGNNEEYLNLTWEYIEHLFTVQHTDYGKGMASIYDGLTYDKYPWEGLGLSDRRAYREYDAFMITKSLFMISLYAIYGDVSNIKRKGIYNNYNEYKDKLKAFCEYKITNFMDFCVCQIPGAHFVARKEIQKYHYKGTNNEAPSGYGRKSLYRPEWHEAGSIKIDNPEEVQSKLFTWKEALAIYNYYHSHYITHRNEIWWEEMLASGYADNRWSGQMSVAREWGILYEHFLLLYDQDYILNGEDQNGIEFNHNGDYTKATLYVSTVVQHKWDVTSNRRLKLGDAEYKGKELYWTDNGNGYTKKQDFYIAIVEKRY